MCLRGVGRSDQNDNNAFTVRAVIRVGARIWRNIIKQYLIAPRQASPPQELEFQGPVGP